MEITTFKGMRNDKGKKYVPPEYFYNICNFNYDNIIGANKIKFPSIVYNGSGTDSVFGIFEYRYLDLNNNLIKESVCIIGDKLYRDWHSGFPKLIVSGLEESKWTAEVYQDKLFLCNGKNYPKIFNGTYIWEMGAPQIQKLYQTGLLNGTYYYEITYVTAGGEQRIGTKSNSISVINNKILLNLQIGYAGTTSRKIYRTVAGGTVPKLVATIADNTTLTYTDNTADGSLGADIIGINNELPKPYFVAVNEDKLIGAVVDLYPTQIFVTGTNIELWDLSADGVDISNQTGDNTAIKGIKVDYNKLIIGTEKEIYFVDVSGTTSVSSTQCNIGMKDGYSVQRIPSSEGVVGGIVFASNLNDIRLFSGNIAQPIATSLDNLITTNRSQMIQNTLIGNLKLSSNIASSFIDYKYHLLIDNKFYIFDIRGGKWTTYDIHSNSYVSDVNVLGIYNNGIYIGQKDADIIEKMYQNTTYRGEEVTSIIDHPQLFYSKDQKFFKTLTIYYKNLNVNKWDITITIDANRRNNKTISANFTDGAYAEDAYNLDHFETVADEEDFRVIHINQWGRYIEFSISPQEGGFYYRGFKLDVEGVENKERVFAQ